MRNVRGGLRRWAGAMRDAGGPGAVRAQKGESGGGATGSAKLFVRRLLCWGCRAGMAARGRRYPMKRPMKQRAPPALAPAAPPPRAVCPGGAGPAAARPV